MITNYSIKNILEYEYEKSSQKSWYFLRFYQHLGLDSLTTSILADVTLIEFFVRFRNCTGDGLSSTITDTDCGASTQNSWGAPAQAQANANGVTTALADVSIDRRYSCATLLILQKSKLMNMK